MLHIFKIPFTALAFAALLSCSKNDDGGGSSGGGTTPPPVVNPATPTAIALAGNAFITQKNAGATEDIGTTGLTNWTDAATTVSTYFKVQQTGSLHLAVKATAAAGASKIKLSVNGSDYTLDLNGAASKVYFAGTVNITTAGYVKVDLKGVSKTGSTFAEVSDIMIGGSPSGVGLIYANDPANYYWSRRGPSCHLNYVVPAGNAEYYYSELMVPAGEDKEGSYYMANGFGQGYFGIQVKSPTERWVLFSVWDPGAGQGLTTLIRKGTDVVAQRFGGEGTGGQSYLAFNWQAGTTYKFLTKGAPDGAGNTVYTSWFFAPEVGDWKLMATWSRPSTVTYLTNFHGFLENFDDELGYTGRKALWDNQWIRLQNGEWKEVTQFKFGVDATGTNKQRMDFDGGMDGQKFYLKNGGFFANSGTPGTLFSRNATNTAPTINFNNLP